MSVSTLEDVQVACIPGCFHGMVVTLALLFQQLVMSGHFATFLNSWHFLVAKLLALGCFHPSADGKHYVIILFVLKLTLR